MAGHSIRESAVAMLIATAATIPSGRGLQIEANPLLGFNRNFSPVAALP